MVIHKLKGIPDLAWFTGSLSMLVLSIGIAVSSIKSSNLSFEMANSKLEVTSKYNRLQDLTRELENALIKLEAREQAYSELEADYNRLVKSNQPIKKLQPKIDNISNERQIRDLQQIKEQLAETEATASQEIKDLVDKKEDSTN